MINRYFLPQCIFSCLIACFSNAMASSITWQAQNSNNDMNDSSNWDPNTVPGSSDTAIFSSDILDIETSPTENSAPFSVALFNFPFNAAVFNFNFNNQTLTFNGAGIAGSNTNPTITVTNTNNSSFPGDLISFIGGTGTSGSSIITSSNSGTLTGNLSGTFIAPINSNLHSSGPFTITDGGRITASNIGNNSANGSGGNGVAYTGSSQLRFDQSFTAGNNVAISASNSGFFSGANTISGDGVGVISGSQFVSLGAFEVGDNFSCTLQNSGNDSSTGIGLSNVGQLNAAQMILQTTGTVGDNCTITLSNTGSNSSEITSYYEYIGYLNDQQFYVANAFQAGDNFRLTAQNIGTDTSNGFGSAQVAVINSNSGTTGNQILFQQGGSLGSHATINATNSGSYSGSNTSGGSTVGLMNLQQVVIGDYSAPGSFSFTAGDYFNLSVLNTGVDSSIGVGGNSIGSISTDQITFFAPTSLSDHANITIAKSGDFSGNSSATYVNIGSSGGSQLNCASSFSVADNFTLSISNSGINTGSGVGSYYIGDLISGQQVNFENNFVGGNNASITISNSGSNSADTSLGNIVGSLMGYGKQLRVRHLFQIGDDSSFSITNSGFDDSVGPGGNYVGYMNNSTVDNSASQMHLAEGGTLGNRTSILLSNTGTYEGINTTSLNRIGALAGQQLYSVSNFQAGDNFALTASNSGTNDTSGQNNNSIGTVGNSQVEFGDGCVIGDNASFILTNSGTNSDTAGISNSVGVVYGSQFIVNGDFTAGKNLALSVSNRGVNEADSSNFVGYVASSQATFVESCTLGAGSIISAFNSGTVGSSQIIFESGFSVTSGRATIQAVNQGDIDLFGIDIQGMNTGGNVGIILGNSSLNIETTLATFTIGGLVGDDTSTAQSQPQLIINTDASIEADFSGVIQNFTSTDSTLVKTGAGKQTLSGINTYTGLTSIEEGILSINGSIVGDVTVLSGGSLKGTGTVGGTATIASGATLSPGNSIGTINLGSLVLTSNSRLAIEIDPTDSSRVNVAGSALVDGELQIIQDQGVYPRQGTYQILSADALSGVFSSVNSLPGFTFTLTYPGDSIHLNYILAIPTEGLCGNSLAVANYLNAEATSSSAFMSLAALSGDALNQALESVSPSRNSFGTYVAAQTAFSLSNVLSTHLDGSRFVGNESSENNFTAMLTADSSSAIRTNKQKKENTVSIWATAFGEFAHQKASEQNPAFSFISEAILAGVDYEGIDKDLAGISIGYAHTRYNENQHAGHGNINYYFASLYGNGFVGDFYLSPAIWGMFNQIDNTRDISFSGFYEKAYADIFAWQLIPHLEIGYDVEFSWGDLAPFTSADWAISWQRGYSEHGASPFNAKQKANNSSMVRSETGLKFCEKWDYSWGGLFLREKLSYVFEKPFGTGTVNSAFVGMPGAFTVTALKQNLNLGTVGVNLLVALGKTNPIKLDFGYEGEFGSKYWSNELVFTVSRGF